ncbi:phosphoglycerate mutase [Flavobacterium album]|uniref:Phosphoglycerate mutase n=1 Tax=Flavobacterium album TaxID=2175091 RepID=A0A2S1QZ28_9FLAO|nr:phosphoglycerate mutase family protein [Flavobacterium album]AWH85650.1 phosphoglycerate mutase [Flavobacterium album]
MTITSAQDTYTTIYLIRHAEKADTSADTHLSEAGKERAVRWMEYLVANRIQAIYTTPYNRTRETAQPLADALNMKPIEYSPRDMDLAAIIKKHENSAVLIVGHSNTIPGYINRLTGKDEYSDIPEDEFGRLYMVNVENGKVIDIQIEEL